MLYLPPEETKRMLGQAPPPPTGTVKVVHASTQETIGSTAPATQEDIDFDYLQRRNDSNSALGKFFHRRRCGFAMLMSFDHNAWYFQATFTAFVIVGNMLVAWEELGWCEFIVCCTLCVTAFVSSALVTCTDPGIYPRFQDGELDPLADKTTLIYCRKCRLRRPPRTSHCYYCDVCVLEHDHHCGILGGCVGMRSLRWFTLFLVAASTACSMGLYWMIRHLLRGLFAPDIVFGTTEPRNTTMTSRVPLRRRTRPTGEPAVSVTLTHLGAVFMILFDLLVVMLVGAMACMYTYLTLTSTTRRESRRNQTSWRVLFRPTVMAANLKRTMFPPASLVVEDKKRDDTIEVAQLV